MLSFYTLSEAIDQEKISKFLDGEEISFFFDFDGTIYGGDEGSRLTFARLKNPDEDSDKTWAENANFYGIDLKRGIKGDKTERMFSQKDVGKIKVKDREDALKSLK